MQGCSSMPECTVRKKNVQRMLLVLYPGPLIRAVEYRLRKQCCDVSEGKKLQKIECLHFVFYNKIIYYSNTHDISIRSSDYIISVSLVLKSP